MFKMGCSMARRILGPGSAGGGNQEQAATCFSVPSSSSSNQEQTKKAHATGKRAASGGNGGENNAKQGQPSSELNDFSKLDDDPRLPLNVRQIFKITKSWKAIARTMSRTGTAMFLNLFEQNQDLFYLFDRFQHLKGKELHESMELREHAATVMATLDTSINSLSDYDNFVSYLHSIGQLHRKVPGFKREYFWKIEQPFMKAVKQTLDERCNETIEEIYKIAIKLIIETIADGYGHEADATGEAAVDSSSREGDAGDSSRRRQDSRGQSLGDNGRSAAKDSEPGGGGAGAGGCTANQASSKQNQQQHQHRQSPNSQCAGRGTLSRIVISTSARLGTRRVRRGRRSAPSRRADRASGAKLIRATCELMSTTEHLIDSCCEDCAGQPRAHRLAGELSHWRAMHGDLQRALMNASHSPRQPDDERDDNDDVETSNDLCGKPRRTAECQQSTATATSAPDGRGGRRSEEGAPGQITLCPMRRAPAAGIGLGEGAARAGETGNGHDERNGGTASRVTGDERTRRDDVEPGANSEVARAERIKDESLMGGAQTTMTMTMTTAAAAEEARPRRESVRRAARDGRPSRAIDCSRPRAAYSISGADPSPPVSAQRRPRQPERPGAGARPRLSRCYLAGKSSLRGEHNGNLYRVSGDCREAPSTRTTSGVNEFGGRPESVPPPTRSSIRISATNAAPATAARRGAPEDEQQLQQLATKSERTKRSDSGQTLAGGGAPSGGACTSERAELETGTNGDGKCDHIGDNHDHHGRGHYNEPACIYNGNASRTGGANRLAAALLQKGETSVKNLLRSIEHTKKSYRGKNGDDDDDNADLIEFVKVIVLINKLILVRASSSIMRPNQNQPVADICLTRPTLVN